MSYVEGLNPTNFKKQTIAETSREAVFVTFIVGQAVSLA